VIQLDSASFLIEIFLLLLCVAAIWFYGYAIYSSVTFFNRPHLVNPDFHPPITILKPVCGLDRDAYNNFASFCRQDYPEYQIIFSVRDSGDAAVSVVQQIISDFPELDIQLVVSDRIIGTNLKVSNLANAVTQAKHEILVIADSDIRVGTDYLQRIIQPLCDRQVGVVTCLYRSSSSGWVSTLEAIGTATDFHAGVLVSNQLAGIQFAFGSTIVIRKSVLEEIGGFLAIADYLADDFQLGNQPAQLGYQVILSDYVVEHVLGTSNLVESIHRQIRWTRCVRVSRIWGYIGLIFTYGTFTSLLFLLVTRGSLLGWAVFSITWIMRGAMGWIVGVRYLNDPVAKKYIWLIFLRDLISFVSWCYGFVGSTIEWRGQQFKLVKGGKLVPVKSRI